MSGWEPKRPFLGSWFHSDPLWKSHLPQQRQAVHFLCSSYFLSLSFFFITIIVIIFASIREGTPLSKSVWLLDDTLFFVYFHILHWCIPTVVQSDFFVSFLITVMDSKDFKHSHVNTVMKQILLSCRPSLSTRQSFIDIRLVSCFYKQFVCLDFTYRASFNQIFSFGSICLVLLVCAFIRPLLLTIPSFFFLTGWRWRSGSFRW